MSSSLACATASAPPPEAPLPSEKKASELKDPPKLEPTPEAPTTLGEEESAEAISGPLAQFVNERVVALRRCYEVELKQNPKLQGSVAVRFSILPTGRTGEVGIEEDTLGNEAVSNCIRTVVQRWEFPFRPKEEVEVIYPFTFSPAW